MSEHDLPPEHFEREPVLDLANLLEVAKWLAEAIAAGIIGTAAYDILQTLRRRFGPNRVQELEELVYQELKKVKRKPNVADQDLRNRAAALFREYEEH